MPGTNTACDDPRSPYPEWRACVALAVAFAWAGEVQSAPHWSPFLLAQQEVVTGGAEAAVPEPLRFDISRFEVSGDTLLGARTIEETTSPYTGARRDFGDVQRALEALQGQYRKRGYGAVQVVLPEQDLGTAGVVRLVVIEPRVRTVRVEGNRHFSKENVLASLPALKEGVVANTADIAAQLELANENPAKKTAVQIRTTGEPEQVDLVANVADQKPWRVGLTLDNSGSDATGKARLGASLQYANLADRDQVITLQYLTSPEKPGNVKIYGIGYHAPLYSLSDSIDLFAGRSDVDSGVVENLFNISGRGTVAGARYNLILRPQGRYRHRAVFGLDYRDYDNRVLFLGGTESLIPRVVVHPASVGYQGRWTDGRRHAAFYTTYVRNVPGGRFGGDDQFALARSQARADYDLLRLGGEVAVTSEADIQLRAVLAAQLTADALVPGEQFGIGGASSVRGFREREVANDSGYSASMEAYSPDFGAWLGAGANARALLFYDVGHARRNKALPEENRNVSVASAGIGLRLSVHSALTLRADYAVVVDEGGSQHEGDGMMHLGVGYVF